MPSGASRLPENKRTPRPAKGRGVILVLPPSFARLSQGRASIGTGRTPIPVSVNGDQPSQPTQFPWGTFGWQLWSHVQTILANAGLHLPRLSAGGLRPYSSPSSPIYAKYMLGQKSMSSVSTQVASAGRELFTLLQLILRHPQEGLLIHQAGFHQPIQARAKRIHRKRLAHLR